MINEEWLKEALKMICEMIKSLEKNITETKSEQEKISSVLKSNPDILKEKDAELDNYIKEYVVKVDETKKNLYSLVENILNNFIFSFLFCSIFSLRSWSLLSTSSKCSAKYNCCSLFFCSSFKSI